MPNRATLQKPSNGSRRPRNSARPEDKKKWAFLLDLYKSGKPYRDQPAKKPEKKAE